MLKRIKTGLLNVAYLDKGPTRGTPVVLLHGFPYAVQAYSEVCQLLAAAGCRVLTPYLRGYGPTQFLSPATPRSGQQAALAHDLLAFMDALKIEQAILAGFDWGGRAACIVAALWPERVQALVSVGGYNIQNIPAAITPQSPEDEYRYWYQYYFHSERGRAGLTQHRHEFCKLLWRLWSPTWDFSDETYNQTALAFDNPDFVEVVIHSYRHRFGLVPGDPALATTEQRLVTQPAISVPSFILFGEADGVTPPAAAQQQSFFSGAYWCRILPGIGHNPPQEAPADFAAAILSLVPRSQHSFGHCR